ncbi:MAG: hypothetical protein IK990_11065 [Ruminiclostridium sp.]|nr:hypothetical protein [Ruminiclostridium sp.]
MLWKNKDRSGHTHAKIETFSIVTLRESGMRGSTEYEIVMNDDKAEISFYWIKYTQGKDCRELDRRALCSRDTIIRLLNDCDIMSWNGFVGNHPKGVLDGTMFTFNATVDQDKKIYAHGSENFPKHYREFVNALNDHLYGDMA